MLQFNKNRTLIISLISIILLLGLLSYLNFRDYKVLKKAFKSEKKHLVTELDKVLSLYDDAIFAKINLSKTILQKKEEILKLRDSIDNLEEKNYQLIHVFRLKIFKLEQENKVLFQKLDSVRTENSNLKTENRSIKYRLRKQSHFSLTLSHQKDSIEKSKKELEKKISVLEKLAIDNLKIIPLKRKRKGYTSTSRHRKVEAFKISYDLLYNELAKKGTRKLYVQLLDNTNQIVFSSEAEMITSNDKKYPFSDVFTVDYKGVSGNYINILEFHKGMLKGGEYQLILFLEGRRVGAKKIYLK